MISWIYLLIASVMEVGWMFSLKFLKLSELKRMTFEAWTPAVGYVVFGIANIYFFSLALKKIPTATAFATWTVVALAGVKLIDIVFLKEPSKALDYFFLGLALIAILGLKKT